VPNYIEINHSGHGSGDDSTKSEKTSHKRTQNGWWYLGNLIKDELPLKINLIWV
jgi:hypothetical protein